MASGTISFVTQGNLMGRIVWEAVSNGIAANTSTVLCTIQARKTSNTTIATTGTWSGMLIIGGKTENFSWQGSVGSNSWVTLKSLSATISHNTNGAGSCRIYGKVSGPSGTTLAGRTVSGSETITLDTIPRQAVLTSTTDFFDTENPVITYTNPLGVAVPSLQAGISLTGTSDCEIAYRDVDKTAGKDTLELTEAERDVLRAATTDKNYRTIWIYLRTRIGETYYYSSNSLQLTILNPKPEISPTITDTNTKTTALTGNSSKLIRYFSNAAITIGATAVKKASIVSKKVTCGAKSLTANGTITAVESNKFVFTAKDSRGNTATLTKTVEMVEYIKLTCSQENTRPNTDGEITIKAKGACFGGSFGAKTNTVTATVVYKAVGGAYGNPVTMSVTKNAKNYEATVKITGLDPDKTYVFKATVTDLLSSASSNERTVKLMPVFDWSGEDFNFNVPVTMQGNFIRAKRCRVGQNASTSTNPWYKFASVTAENLIEDMRISFKVTFSHGSTTRFAILNANIRTENASGANAVQRLEFESNTGLDTSNFVMAHNGTGIGAVYELWVKLTSYRFCFFEVLSESSRTAYINKWVLYNQISAGYAEEPTSGYTQVQATSPYLLGSYPVGSYYISHSDTSPASLFGGTWHRIESRFLWAAPATSELGKTAGEMTHTLTVNEMPSHSHGLYYRNEYSLSGPGNGLTNVSGGQSTTTQAGVKYMDNTGGGAAHNNMPPYVNVAIWRRTA